MSDRINARLNSKLAGKLRKAKAMTHKSVTEIVTESLDQYCDGLLRASDSGVLLRPYDVFAASGAIGQFEGPGDLGANHKKYLAESFGEKKR